MVFSVDRWSGGFWKQWRKKCHLPDCCFHQRFRASYCGKNVFCCFLLRRTDGTSKTASVWPQPYKSWCMSTSDQSILCECMRQIISKFKVNHLKFISIRIYKHGHFFHFRKCQHQKLCRVGLIEVLLRSFSRVRNQAGLSRTVWGCRNLCSRMRPCSGMQRWKPDVLLQWLRTRMRSSR